jgi:hypothetical protein
VPFLESGVSLVVATHDAELTAHCAFAVGLRVHAGGRRVAVYLPRRPAAASIADLESNGAVAITACNPVDFRTLQLKGRAVRVAEAPEVERRLVLAYRDALAERLEQVGDPRALVGRLAVWPAVAVEVELEAVFEQTPGPRAGSPLDPG